MPNTNLLTAPESYTWTCPDCATDIVHDNDDLPDDGITQGRDGIHRCDDCDSAYDWGRDWFEGDREVLQ